MNFVRPVDDCRAIEAQRIKALVAIFVGGSGIEAAFAAHHGQRVRWVHTQDMIEAQGAEIERLKAN